MSENIYLYYLDFIFQAAEFDLTEKTNELPKRFILNHKKV